MRRCLAPTPVRRCGCRMLALPEAGLTHRGAALGRGRSLTAAVLIAGVATAVLAAPVAAALRSNTIVANPITLTQGTTKWVDVTVTNVGTGGGGEEIGCVTVQVPGAFDTLDASIASLPTGYSWKASISGASGSSVLVKFRREGPARRWRQAGAGGVPGARHADRDWDRAWVTIAYNDKNCSGGPFPGLPLRLRHRPRRDADAGPDPAAHAQANTPADAVPDPRPDAAANASPDADGHAHPAAHHPADSASHGRPDADAGRNAATYPNPDRSPAPGGTETSTPAPPAADPLRRPPRRPRRPPDASWRLGVVIGRSGR